MNEVIFVDRKQISQANFLLRTRHSAYFGFSFSGVQYFLDQKENIFSILTNINRQNI